MGEDEVCKSSLRADPSKLRLVGWVHLGKTFLLDPLQKQESHLKPQANSQHERCNTRDEAREEGIEGEGSNQAAVEELEDSSKEDVGEIGIDDLEFLGSVVVIFLVELGNNS